MSVSPANIAGEGHDPKGPNKLDAQAEHDVVAAPSYDDASFEHEKPSFRTYMELAEQSRERERRGGGAADATETPTEKPSAPALTVREEELLNARRALRTASWAAVFYLITTDILGPFNAPYAISQVGYVPGVILYVVMGGVACYTGLILSKIYCKLDSDRYPIRSYGDMAGRIFGTWFKHVCSILQSIQLIINVGLICLSNGQGVAQIAAGGKEFCFSIQVLIWALVGMFTGQIRSLKNYGWLANSAVWLNLFIIFTSMGFVSHSPPNIAAAQASYGPSIGDGPVQTQTFVSLPLYSKVNGIMNMVFAYGGAMIFPEFMAEMRRPMDFWKGMCCAQALIGSVYLLYGVFVYAYQGQYTLPLAYQGVSKYAWQTLNNVIALLTGIIAAGLYGNIGIKIAYINLVEDWGKGPALMSRKGRYVWSGMVLLYWALAFIVGSAIPQVATISALVAAVCIMQFTYTFPPLFLLGLDMTVDAMRDEQGDTWRNWSRWRRGYFTGNWVFKTFNLILFLASAAMACLGMYGAGMSIQAAFKEGAATSFGCTAPV